MMHLKLGWLLPLILFIFYSSWSRFYSPRILFLVTHMLILITAFLFLPFNDICRQISLHFSWMEWTSHLQHYDARCWDNYYVSLTWGVVLQPRVVDCKLFAWPGRWDLQMRVKSESENQEVFNLHCTGTSVTQCMIILLRHYFDIWDMFPEMTSAMRANMPFGTQTKTI